MDFNKFLKTPPPGVTKSAETIPYVEYKWATELQAGAIEMDNVVAEAKRQLDRMKVVGLF